MESLSDTRWDVVISGTGLRHSLLALALSRSNKKILHVDENDYYGGPEAAFSLQEVDEWVEELGKVGNWWIYNAEEAVLKRLPNGREDIFQDKNIDNRAKRNLMKFLKFVVDYENQTDVWEAQSESGLDIFLSSKFNFPAHLQIVITALTLSLAPPSETSVKWALPRIARHLTSIGLFGPGFGAVVPKWGGGAEISQVACRAGAVGGGVYVLGTGIENVKVVEAEDTESPAFHLALSNGEAVGTKLYVHEATDKDNGGITTVSKAISIISSSVPSLFRSTVEGSPLAAVSVVVFPPMSLQIADGIQSDPVYIMVHSSETGECPAGQTPSGSPLDLSFDDQLLEQVEAQWREVMAEKANEESFMQFEERKGMEAEEEDDNDY
ncbi:putative Rab proteins geranylgeranyltransferase component A [Glarea lozoyensis 74030]|uniref:Putative Rab proteins geranylgeranyltransferase component A n=1 Tax=Glarea lozoyensis (strain ATCC 74030 / MF5533) TaxID=1104152 RepID=H0EKB6_GLAL7|nr:putative Rab proteins geranylgeranyltransferase component A [Glarea lozoyensis 74030]